MVKIFVGSLSNEVTIDDLAELFAKYGYIDECEKLENKMFGFVKVVDERAANTAVMKVHRRSYKGNRIIVDVSSKTWPDLVASKQDPRLEVRRRLLNYSNAPHPFNRRDSS